jgi:hypothetical protein
VCAKRGELKRICIDIPRTGHRHLRLALTMSSQVSNAHRGISSPTGRSPAPVIAESVTDDGRSTTVGSPSGLSSTSRQLEDRSIQSHDRELDRRAVGNNPSDSEVELARQLLRHRVGSAEADLEQERSIDDEGERRAEKRTRRDNPPSDDGQTDPGQLSADATAMEVSGQICR